MKNEKDKQFFLGLSLAPNANSDSGIAIIDKDLNLILLDKLYSDEDINFFFKNYCSVSDTIFAVSLAQDNSLLNGKWRMAAKNYKEISNGFTVNADNWTNRLTGRTNELFYKLKLEGNFIFRYFNFQLRQALKVPAIYQERTSIDCKSLQTALKDKYGFQTLPENMLPASNLEAILGAMLAKKISDGQKYQKIGEFKGLDILNILM